MYNFLSYSVSSFYAKKEELMLLVKKISVAVLASIVGLLTKTVLSMVCTLLGCVLGNRIAGVSPDRPWDGVTEYPVR